VFGPERADGSAPLGTLRCSVSPVLQRLQRRAIVVLAWLVLALSVAPAAAEPLRPLTVYAAAASSLSLGAAGPGPGRVVGDSGARDTVAARGARAARGGITHRAEALTPTVRASRAAAPPAALPSPPHACRCGVRDGRRLYLSICRLSC
jgi:hypothetical protein